MLNFRKRKVPTSVLELPMVLVQWSDARFDLEDQAALTNDIKEFGKLYEREDIGFLVRVDRKELVLCVTRDIEDNEVCYSNTIPRGWVKKVTYLQPIPEEKAE